MDQGLGVGALLENQRHQGGSFCNNPEEVELSLLDSLIGWILRMSEREVKDVSYLSRLSKALADSKHSNLGFYLETVLLNVTHNF